MNTFHTLFLFSIVNFEHVIAVWDVLCSMQLEQTLGLSLYPPYINSLNVKVTIHRNQSIVLQSLSIDWFLYDDHFGV